MATWQALTDGWRIFAGAFFWTFAVSSFVGAYRSWRNKNRFVAYLRGGFAVLFGALTWGLIHTLPYDKREVALCGLVVMALITLYRRSYPNGYSALRRGRKKEVRRLCRSGSVVRLVEILLRTAALDNVHQVVLIPQARQGKVQFRRSDHPVHETRLPLHLLRLVEERFKQMCDLPLHNAPQEWVGSFRFVHNDRRYGVLARAVATAWGAQTTLQIVPETE